MSKLKTDANGLSVNKESTFYEHRKVQGWEGELHFITSGDKEAQPVVFLHGIKKRYFQRSIGSCLINI